MSTGLSELLKLSEQIEGTALEGHPKIELARRMLLEKIQTEVKRMVPERILRLEKEQNLAVSYNQTLETYDRFGLWNVQTPENALMSAKEVRNAIPSIGDVLEEFGKRPELLAKVEQGFVHVHPVPFGFAPESLREPLSAAIRTYKNAGTLRSTDGTALRLDVNEPVWMWDEYKGADASGRLVYFPERFDPKQHGGKTKKELLSSARFPGWQVLLLENLRDIPRQGKGASVGGRPQIKANGTPHEYLELLRADAHKNETGLTPEAWMSLALAHLTKTNGEIIDDYQSGGSACYCLGGYFPSSGVVPCAYWDRDRERAYVSRERSCELGSGCWRARRGEGILILGLRSSFFLRSCSFKRRVDESGFLTMRRQVTRPGAGCRGKRLDGSPYCAGFCPAPDVLRFACPYPSRTSVAHPRGDPIRAERDEKSKPMRRMRPRPHAFTGAASINLFRRRAERLLESRQRAGEREQERSCEQESE